MSEENKETRLAAWVGQLSRAEAQDLLNLLIDEHALTDEGDFLQDVFCAHYVQLNHNVHKALKATGVGYDRYSQWVKDPVFKAKLAFANQAVVNELFSKARELAMAGEGDMLKFLLSALDPDVFDAKYRAQHLANQGAIAAATEGMRSFTMAELRDLLRDDPAQQFTRAIDVTPDSEPEKDNGPPDENTPF